MGGSKPARAKDILESALRNEEAAYRFYDAVWFASREAPSRSAEGPQRQQCRGQESRGSPYAPMGVV